MSDDDISAQLLTLSNSVKLNQRLCLALIASSLVLVIALSSLMWQGLQQLQPLQQQAPDYLVHQAKNQLWGMRLAAEKQYDELRADHANNPLLTLKDALYLHETRLSQEEQHWGITLDLYNKLLYRLSRHLGGAEEWQYFQGQKLTTLINQSSHRQATLRPQQNGTGQIIQTQPEE